MSSHNLRWVVRDGVKVLQELHYIYPDKPVTFSEISLSPVYCTPAEQVVPQIVWIDVPIEEENINE